MSLLINTEGNAFKCSYCLSEIELLYKSIEDKIFWNEGEWDIYKCDSCNLVSLIPPPPKEELGKYYQSYYTHLVEKSFLRKRVNSFSDFIIDLHYNSRANAGKRVLNFLIPGFIKNLFTYEIYNLKTAEGKEIFDVGFGNGNFISKMVKLGVFPGGCDFDKKCVDIIKEKYDLQVYHGALNEINTGKKYDIITYGHVVEHLYDLKEELTVAKDKLNNRGRVIGLTPNIESLGHSLFKRSWRGLEPPRHLHIYSIDAIKKISEECGFRIISIKTTARYARHILAASLMVRLNRKASVSGGGRGVWIALSGYVLQGVEWAYNLFKKNAGEEIYFVLESK